MKDQIAKDSWTSVAAAARRAGSSSCATESEAPHGFATRVAAHARPASQPSAGTWRRRGLLLAFLGVFGTGYAASHFTTGSGVAHYPQLSLWGNELLEALRGPLHLSPEQEETLLPVISQKEEQLEDLKKRALLEYRLLLLEAHDEIAPRLDAEQQEALHRSREKLSAELAH